jgi:hypothetical protein
MLIKQTIFCGSNFKRPQFVAIEREGRIDKKKEAAAASLNRNGN